jgi:hypothetical protein
MDIIKFCGRTKKDALKKAMGFFSDNCDDGEIENFLARCRVQEDGTTIHYYPHMAVNIDDYRKRKRDKKKKKGSYEED